MINLKIRINVDEQTLTLPVDTQSVPGIPEKDPVVMVFLSLPISVYGTEGTEVTARSKAAISWAA